MIRAIHVLAVDDSAVVRRALIALLSKEPGFTVATAIDPLIAMDKMRRQRPDVILLDLLLPRMDGLTFLKKIMSEDPIPVVICSGLAGRGTELALRALEAGAVEIVTKPSVGVRQFLEESAVLLADAIRAAAQARRPAHGVPREAGTGEPSLLLGEGPSDGETGRRPEKAAVPVTLEPRAAERTLRAIGSRRVVAIGASTGGTQALRAVLEPLPADAPGLVIVQHMPEGFTAAFARSLNQSCRMEVKEAEDGDQVGDGLALIAPGNRHTVLCRQGASYFVRVFDGPLVSRHRPSVDALFRSVARVAGPDAVGILLTGMGDDGAEGLLDMRGAGALTVAQDEASCVVFGMPKEAIARGAVERVVPLGGMAAVVLQAGSREPRRRRLRPPEPAPAL